MLQHEFLRPRNENLMSDVYDAPSWKDLMGEPVFPNFDVKLTSSLNFIIISFIIMIELT